MTTAPKPTERALRLHYVAITPKDGGEVTERLILAKTQNGAVSHVVGRAIICRPATPEEAHALGKLGVEIETAGADTTADAPTV